MQRLGNNGNYGRCGYLRLVRNTGIVLTGCLLQAGLSVQAQVPEDSPPEAGTATNSTTSASGIRPPDKRDPFLPVGYIPRAYRPKPKDLSEDAPYEPAGPEEPADTSRPRWKDAMKQISIRGIMKLGSEYVATVNGQVVKKGDLVALIYEGNRYRWRVRTIAGNGKVRLKPLDFKKVESMPAVQEEEEHSPENKMITE
jgi:hypothetical protein